MIKTTKELIASFTEDEKNLVDMTGRDLFAQLEDQWKENEAGIDYAKIMNKYARRAASLGVALTEFANILQHLGFIKYVISPNGKRMVFSGKCPLTKEEMQDWFQTIEMARETEKEFKKINTVR